MLIALAATSACSDRPARVPAVAASAPSAAPVRSPAVEYVPIGGRDQAILVHEGPPGSPVVLFLHGGPGNSEMTVAHQYGGLLATEFTVVHWDQRGAGRSFSPDERLEIGRMVDDAIEVSSLLRRRYPDRPLLLVGNSWGTILGILSVQRRPDLFCAYVGVSQFVDARKGMELAYERMTIEARQRKDDASATALMELGRPPYETTPKVMAFIGIVTRLGGMLHAATSADAVERLRATSPIARTPSELHGDDQLHSFHSLLPAILDIDLERQAGHLGVPVYLFQGTHDWVTPAALAERYLERLDAPTKKIVRFEWSAHLPQIEQPRRFAGALLQVKRESCSAGERRAPP